MLARFLKKDDRTARGKDVLTVSFVVIVYNMPLQAENTVRSLLPGYQLGVSGDEYEVIVVENASANTMRPEFLQGLPANVRYSCVRTPNPARRGQSISARNRRAVKTFASSLMAHACSLRVWCAPFSWDTG